MATDVPRLYVREGHRVVDAPDADQEVVRRYPEWEHKGPIRDGVRLTIMAASTRVRSGEEVRVIHVFEAVERGIALYVMGPKPVHGEYVDDELRSQPVPPGSDPLVPASYDGRVLQGPGLDVNWDVTTYRFDAPGSHAIRWQPGDYRSNELRVDVA